MCIRRGYGGRRVGLVGADSLASIGTMISIRASCHRRRAEKRLQMKSYNIAVIGGDGTGPEVVREAVKVLDVAAKKFKHFLCILYRVSVGELVRLRQNISVG